MNNIVITVSITDLMTFIIIIFALLLDAFVLGQMKERKKLTGTIRPSFNAPEED